MPGLPRQKKMDLIFTLFTILPWFASPSGVLELRVGSTHRQLHSTVGEIGVEILDRRRPENSLRKKTGPTLNLFALDQFFIPHCSKLYACVCVSLSPPPSPSPPLLEFDFMKNDISNTKRASQMRE